MKVQLRKRILFATTLGVFAFGVLSSSGVYAAGEGGGASTATLVGAVTCGADEITPANNAIVSVAGLTTRTDTSGRFTLTGVPAGEQLRLDAANDTQQSFMNSRFDIVAEAGQTLDVGSIDLSICPSPTTQSVTTDTQIEQRDYPND